MIGALSATAVEQAFTSALCAMQCAQRVVQGFLRYNEAFRRITLRAPERFAVRDWAGSQADAVERIELYNLHVRDTVDEITRDFDALALDRRFWTEVKRHFDNLLEGLPDGEFCKTYFNSITRKLFCTVGVAPEIEFVATDLDPLAGAGRQVSCSRHLRRGSLDDLVDMLLRGVRLPVALRDIPQTTSQIVAEMVAQIGISGRSGADVVAVEVIDAVFYQFARAYVVGRIEGSDFQMPVVLAFRNTDIGVVLDNVMLTQAEIGNLFGYTRSYFHVDLDHVADTVAYLKTLIPQAPVGELFTVLGRAKQGKTERNRQLIRHMEASTDMFQHAPGQRGLVMICFTMPSMDVVFKVIRDRIPVQKNLSRDEVIDKYRFVFNHDRAGRLIDAQEFRRLRVPRARFDAGLFYDLVTDASALVHVEGDDVVLEHVYIERRVTPLDLYLRTAKEADATGAAVDYGHAIRDLAYTNIFAGDLLFKNFGVTQHGRVIFYDYDEVVPLTQCRFRELPAALHHEEEMSAEPWFAVNEEDVFPETFHSYLPFSKDQLEAFMAMHGELLRSQFWRQVQDRIRSGAILEVMPYVKRPSLSTAGD
ncbi:MAG: bifunctional isocitrate dehydrogenase kinase/phosphatase [Steroidobacterales bacterium]